MDRRQTWWRQIVTDFKKTPRNQQKLIHAKLISQKIFSLNYLPVWWGGARKKYNSVVKWRGRAESEN